jgi:hypothetical protein
MSALTQAKHGENLTLGDMIILFLGMLAFWRRM